MARIPGLEAEQAGWFARIAYWMTKRKVGRVILPMKITAHQPRLLWAVGQMEMAQAALRSVDNVIKCLVDIQAAMMIGCPF
jgi:hypothetical protein